MEAKETTNEKNEEQKAPILVMTLEIEEGNTKQIKLYSDSNSGEVAFSFCKENNLDYEYLTHLKEQIDLLLAQQKKEESNKPIEDKNINKGNVSKRSSKEVEKEKNNIKTIFNNKNLQVSKINSNFVT